MKMKVDLGKSFKKEKLYYPHCQLGGLHTGQSMTLVCVDSACNKRGLVCPICKVEAHESHQILPIKVFLDKIREIFTSNDDRSDLNSLSDYLRVLEETKKGIFQALKASITSISEAFRTLEQRVQENFNSIRKNVLSQSVVSTKLPNLFSLLTQKSPKNAEDMQREFRLYSELLKYENEALVIADKAKKIVQDYALMPNKLRTILETLSGSLTLGLQSLSLKNEEENKQVPENIAYSFSTTKRYEQILLEEGNKIARCPENIESLGMVFVEEGLGQLKQTLNLQVLKCPHQSAIALGVGNYKFFRDSTCYMFQIASSTQNKDNYSVYVPDSQEINQCIQPKSINNIRLGIGDKIEMNYNGNSKELVIKNLTSNAQVKLVMAIGDGMKDKMQFFVGLQENSSVKII